MAKSSFYLKFVLYALLFLGLFYSAIPWLLRMWEREDFNYCYLIPLVVLYLIWEKRGDFIKEKAKPSWGGIFLFLLVLFCIG